MAALACVLFSDIFTSLCRPFCHATLCWSFVCHLEYDPSWEEPAINWDHPGVKALLAEQDQYEAERVQLQRSIYRSMVPERLVRCTHNYSASTAPHQLWPNLL